MPRGRLASGQQVGGPADLSRAILRAARPVRAGLHREADDLRAGPAAALPGHAGGARHRARGRGADYEFEAHRGGHRGQRCLPDAAAAGCAPAQEPRRVAQAGTGR